VTSYGASDESLSDRQRLWRPARKSGNEIAVSIFLRLVAKALVKPQPEILEDSHGWKLATAIILLSMTSSGAAAKTKHRYAFEHGITGYTPAQFARECIKCQGEAEEIGRSVGGYCPSDCGYVRKRNLRQQESLSTGTLTAH
jgi:hypothetical protein